MVNYVKSALIFALLPNLAAADGLSALSPMCRDFRLDVSGLTYTWQNWVNGNSITTNAHTGEIRWGVGPHGAPNSGMRATSEDVAFPLSLPINTEFALGKLTHLNFPIYAGGAVTNVELMITVHTSHGDFSFTYDLEVDETPNIHGTCEHYSPLAPCADQILVINDPTPQTFNTMDGKEFEIDLLGFREDLLPGADTTTEFISQEGGESSAYLFGSLYLTDCPRAGGGMGDPHFQTWTGNWYEFQGECDMHLVNAPNFSEESPLTIDVRTKVKDNTWFSFIEAAAIKIGDDILEVSSYGVHSFNGVGMDFLNGEDKDKDILMDGKYAVTHEQQSKKHHKYIINIEGNERIVIKTFKELLSVQVENARMDRFVDSTGLMGDFETGEVYGRGGKHVILEDPIKIAREWQVRDDEPMLFEAAAGPQYPQACKMPNKKAPGLRGPGSASTVPVAEAEKACSHLSNEAAKKRCIIDVQAAGDIEIAATF